MQHELYQVSRQWYPSQPTLIYPHYAAAAAKSLQSCPTLCDPIDGSSPGFPVPGNLQARSLECYHFLLQCMKVKTESEVALSCPTLSDPMDCSLPGSSICGFSRQEHWSGVPLPSPILIMSPTQIQWFTTNVISILLLTGMQGVCNWVN